MIVQDIEDEFRTYMETSAAETITILKTDYEYLLKRDKELSRLERNGVDNWSGYSEGFDDDSEE